MIVECYSRVGLSLERPCEVPYDGNLFLDSRSLTTFVLLRRGMRKGKGKGKGELQREEEKEGGQGQGQACGDGDADEDERREENENGDEEDEDEDEEEDEAEQVLSSDRATSELMVRLCAWHVFQVGYSTLPARPCCANVKYLPLKSVHITI